LDNSAVGAHHPEPVVTDGLRGLESREFAYFVDQPMPPSTETVEGRVANYVELYGGTAAPPIDAEEAHQLWQEGVRESLAKKGLTAFFDLEPQDGVEYECFWRNPDKPHVPSEIMKWDEHFSCFITDGEQGYGEDLFIGFKEFTPREYCEPEDEVGSNR
jgi:hypothetical protein